MSSAPRGARAGRAAVKGVGKQEQGCGLCFAHHHQMRSRRSRPTLQGRRNLDANSHAHIEPFGVTSVLPAVPTPFATPCLSGARGPTLDKPTDRRRNRTSSRGARLPQGGDASRAGRAPRLDKASNGGQGAGAAVRGDRAVRRGRRTTLDGQPSGPRWLSRMKPRERLGAGGASGTEAAKVRQAGPRGRFQKGLKTVCDHVFQRRQPRQAVPTAAEASQNGHTRNGTRKTAANDTTARLKDNTVQEKSDTSTLETRKPQEGETEGQDPKSLEGAAGQHARICRALRFQMSKVMLE